MNGTRQFGSLDEAAAVGLGSGGNVNRHDIMCEVFGRSTRLFIPVIHHHTPEAALESIRVAHRAGADGVCLIDQGIEWRPLMRSLWALRSEFPSLPIGVNILAGQRHAAGHPIGVHRSFDWTDHRTRFAHVQGVPWFGGVAFKTEAPVPEAEYVIHAGEALDAGCTVLVTSGAATGVAAPADKVRAMRQAVDHAAGERGTQGILGLASGVTVDNAATFAPWVDVWLVATGIERSFGVLDSARTMRLAEIVHGE